MKYMNIKRYKFSTISKNFNTLIVKNFKTLGNNVLRIFRTIVFKQYSLTKIYKYLDIRRYDFTKITRYLDIRRYNFTKITRYFDPRIYNIDRLGKIKLISSKVLLLHFPLAIIFFGLLYLIIPTFYSYDKSNIEKVLCSDQKIECSIKGEVNYNFYPTPRIKIKNLIINDFSEKKKYSNNSSECCNKTFN